MQKKLTLIFSWINDRRIVSSLRHPPRHLLRPRHPTRSMNISGTGEVSLVPDIARVNIGVHTEADLVADALSIVTRPRLMRSQKRAEEYGGGGKRRSDL